MDLMNSEKRMTIKDTDESRQREIFQLLVTLQDQGLAVRQSREQVAKEASITVEEVQAIERIGLEQNWPPLD